MKIRNNTLQVIVRIASSLHLFIPTYLAEQTNVSHVLYHLHTVKRKSKSISFNYRHYLFKRKPLPCRTMGRLFIQLDQSVFSIGSNFSIYGLLFIHVTSILRLVPVAVRMSIFMLQYLIRLCSPFFESGKEEGEPIILTWTIVKAHTLPHKVDSFHLFTWWTTSCGTLPYDSYGREGLSSEAKVVVVRQHGTFRTAHTCDPAYSGAVLAGGMACLTENACKPSCSRPVLTWPYKP